MQNHHQQPRTTLLLSLAGAAAIAAAAGACASGARKADAASGSPAKQASGQPAVAKPKLPSEYTRYEAMDLMGYRPEWGGFAIVERNARTKFVDIAGDLVLVHSTGNAITALESGTGAVRWSLDLGSELIKFVGNLRSETGDVLACSETDVQILDGQTGILKDRQRLAILAETRPALVGSMLVFGSPSGEVLGHNLISGYKQWGFDLSGAINANPVVVGPTIGVVSQGGEVAFLDPRTGATSGGTRIFGGLTTNPVADDSRMYLAGTDQSVWAFNAFGAQRVWRVRTDLPLTDQPTLHDGRLYVAIAKEGLAAIDASTGERLWTTAGLRGTIIAVRAGNLLLWDKANSNLMSIDPARGDVLNTVRLSGVSLIATSALADGDIYLAEDKGLVQRFAPRK